MAHNNKSMAAPVVKFGSFVAALDSSGDRVKIGYDDADKIIDSLRNNARRTSQDIIDYVAKQECCNAISIEIVNADRYPEISVSSSELPPGVITGTNLPEVIVTFDKFHCLVRSSFTVCADDDGFNLKAEDDLNIHSKIWTRFLLVGDASSEHPIKIWPEDQIDEFYRIISKLRESIQNISCHVYEKAVKKCNSNVDSLERAHEMTLANYGVSRAAFNSVVSSLPKRDFIAFRKNSGWKADKKTIASGRLPSLVKHAKIFFVADDLPDRPRKITKLIDDLRNREAKLSAKNTKRQKREYSVVAVDDEYGVRGTFLVEADDKSSKFVGIAADSEVEFRKIDTSVGFSRNSRPADGAKKYKISRSNSNRAVTILAVDIATGL